MKVRAAAWFVVLLHATACPAKPPPKLVSTPKDARFKASPHRNMDEAWTSLTLDASISARSGVVRGRPLMLTLTAGRGGSKARPLSLRWDELELVATGPDGGAPSWKPELISEQSSPEVAIDSSRAYVTAEWFIPGNQTLEAAVGTYRFRARWGGADAFVEVAVVESISSGIADQSSRRWAALDSASAARSRKNWVEVLQAVEPMLTELPDDPALLRVKAEALEQVGDLEGAWTAIRRGVKSTAPPPGVEPQEVPDPLSLEAQGRIGAAVMRQRADAGTP